MKKKRVYVILLIVLLMSCLLALGFQRKIGVQQVVDNNYKTNKDLIKNYAKESNTQYLSESIGQYLYYLLLAEDEKEFKQQVDSLRKNFLAKQPNGTFIKWVATAETTTNASVDDFRIIEVLRKASTRFQDSSYLKLADELEEALNSNQLTDGVLVDFYDWNVQKKTNTLHLSYINHQIIKENTAVDKAAYQKIVIESSKLETPFFKEIYDVEKQVYLSADKGTVNMIDQLMIAIQYIHFTEQIPKAFDQWLKEEWDTKGKLFGGYLKEDLAPAVPYESSAVYALAILYFNLSHEETYVNELQSILLNQPSFDKNADYSTIHFFDYMWSETVNLLYKNDFVNKQWEWD
ncbi:hypothetical protein [Carnobacterium antarcticum]|uniref:Uncharacterized protein n=1 Tax=Carnobacterium antarcticum TaxID=2126436 RepID=A0ABW4NPQ5_9LACT|nr:hypothetical protein [Carnobacterium sp. CP1]ALV22016.1 hypothetical protein NY10_1411 [Carnobacterium sp. CP1]